MRDNGQAGREHPFARAHCRAPSVLDALANWRAKLIQLIRNALLVARLTRTCLPLRSRAREQLAPDVLISINWPPTSARLALSGERSMGSISLNEIKAAAIVFTNHDLAGRPSWPRARWLASRPAGSAQFSPHLSSGARASLLRNELCMRWMSKAAEVGTLGFVGRRRRRQRRAHAHAESRRRPLKSAS